jgi:hypothetical protein
MHATLDLSRPALPILDANGHPSRTGYGAADPKGHADAVRASAIDTPRSPPTGKSARWRSPEPPPPAVRPAGASPAAEFHLIPQTRLLMGFDQYHEPQDELPEETRTFAHDRLAHRGDRGINWYEQRLAVEQDEEAKAIMQNAQGEEFKHLGWTWSSCSGASRSGGRS